ncbi:MAG: hypothetical protein HQK67_05870 [Desulfamplus sp.]|nr:hypothetical protein [Desulfamplus sp.]
MMQIRTKEEIKDRCRFLVSLFEEFHKEYNTFTDIYLCHEIIANIVVSYFDDIDRMKEYHSSIKLADEHKIAAFTAKWIVNMKPIQMGRELIKPKDRKLLSNEFFAFYAATSILGISNTRNLPDSLRYNLIYMFRHRHFTGRTLASICFCMDEINQLKNTIQSATVS